MARGQCGDCALEAGLGSSRALCEPLFTRLKAVKGVIILAKALLELVQSLRRRGKLILIMARPEEEYTRCQAVSGD